MCKQNKDKAVKRRKSSKKEENTSKKVKKYLKLIKEEMENENWNGKKPLDIYVGYDFAPFGKKVIDALNEKLKKDKLKADLVWDYADEAKPYANINFFISLEKTS